MLASTTKPFIAKPRHLGRSVSRGLARPIAAAWLAGCAMVLAIGGSAGAQSADPSVGHRIAVATCSSCHFIGADPQGRSPRPDAPSFGKISRMPSTTELAIAVFLRTSHDRMPNIVLSREEIDSVAAYIHGLAQE